MDVLGSANENPYRLGEAAAAGIEPIAFCMRGRISVDVTTLIHTFAHSKSDPRHINMLTSPEFVATGEINDHQS